MSEWSVSQRRGKSDARRANIVRRNPCVVVGKDEHDSRRSSFPRTQTFLDTFRTHGQSDASRDLLSSRRGRSAVGTTLRAHPSTDGHFQWTEKKHAKGKALITHMSPSKICCARFASVMAPASRPGKKLCCAIVKWVCPTVVDKGDLREAQTSSTSRRVADVPSTLPTHKEHLERVLSCSNVSCAPPTLWYR